MVLWRAPHATVKVALAADITISTGEAMATTFTNATPTGTAITAYMKDVTISVPEGDVDTINLLGAETIVSSKFQNMLLDPKPFGLAELSGTLVFQDDEILEHNSKHLFFGTKTTSPSSYSRYRAGSVTSGAYDRPEIAIMVSLADATDVVTFVLDNAFITQLGEFKVEADGGGEFEITVKCKPGDFHVEWKDA